ncbi:MAG: cyclic nucleotide-binding domain-containing protein [Candidatus Methylomirabilales bacterium]
MEVVEFLKRVQLFEGLSEEALRRIASLGREQRYPSASVIFREGDPGEAFYVVIDGAVRVSKFVPGAGEEAMAFMEKGDCFGEMSLIDNRPRSATAIAHADCWLLAIGREEFLDLLRSDRELAWVILWGLCRILSLRLRETSDRFVTVFAIARAF